LGTVHVAVSNETSSHVILRTSPDLAAVKTVSRKIKPIWARELRWTPFAARTAAL